MKLIENFSYIALLLIIESSFVIWESEALTIKISQGEILGKTSTSRNGREFYSFLGIPYGVVPQRFMESIPAPGWNNIKDTTMYGQACLTTDDCLFLNVFTPVVPKKQAELLPVMFWIHGGAFQFGSSSDYGPEYFMDEDIVLVTINYRVGVYGFFTMDTNEAPGNQGLKDQVLALKWNQENIEFFQGDKNRVTIFGESAGGVSVNLHVLSPVTKGLFHGAISQSGTALCPWAFRTDVKQESLSLAAKLGCEGREDQVLECMKHVGNYQIWKARGSSIVPDTFVKPMSFVPTIERRADVGNSTIFLPNTPMELARKGQFHPVPYIMGNNKYETGMANFIMGLVSNDTARDWLPYFGPKAFGYADRADAAKITREIQKTYFKNVRAVDSQSIMSKIVNDRAFLAATRISALFHSTKSPTYLYFFDKPGYAALVPYLSQGTPQHTDELTYEFLLTKPPYYGSYPIPKEDKEYEFSADLVRNWATFAKEGKPGNRWASKEIKWERVNEDNMKWLHINLETNLQEEHTFFQRRMNFWSKFYNA